MHLCPVGACKANEEAHLARLQLGDLKGKATQHRETCQRRRVPWRLCYEHSMTHFLQMWVQISG